MLRMKTVLRESLGELQELDEEEIEAFTMFCFTIALGAVSNKSQKGLKKSATARFSVAPGSKSGNTLPQHMSDEELSNLALNLTSFTAASSMSHTVVLDHIVTLFDRDRNVGLLEKLFMPNFIRKTVWFKDKRTGSSDLLEARLSDLSQEPESSPCVEPKDDSKNSFDPEIFAEFMDKVTRLEDTATVHQQQLAHVRKDLMDRICNLDTKIQEKLEQQLLLSKETTATSQDPCCTQPSFSEPCCPEQVHEASLTTESSTEPNDNHTSLPACLPSSSSQEFCPLLHASQEAADDVVRKLKSELEEHILRISDLEMRLRTSTGAAMEQADLICELNSRLSYLELHDEEQKRSRSHQPDSDDMCTKVAQKLESGLGYEDSMLVTPKQARILPTAYGKLQNTGSWPSLTRTPSSSCSPSHATSQMYFDTVATEKCSTQSVEESSCQMQQSPCQMQQPLQTYKYAKMRSSSDRTVHRLG